MKRPKEEKIFLEIKKLVDSIYKLIQKTNDPYMKENLIRSVRFLNEILNTKRKRGS
jgi:hypothetical protein